MNADRDHEPTTSDAVDDALRTYPLVAAPPIIMLNVMARLRGLPPELRPRFRLGWLDYVLGLFTTGMAGVGWILWQSIPPQVMAHFQIEWLILLQRLTQLATRLPALGG